MRVVIRVDASSSMGSGHVARCLTLAGGLRDRASIVEFVCREHDGHLCDLIAAQGFLVSRLTPQVVEHPGSRGYARWLGASWEQDARQTRAVIAGVAEKPDWLVVDHYAVDRDWEQSVRPAVGHLMVVDDLADRPHECDVLLDQNLVAQMRTRYDGKLPSACARLLGPQYALLQPGYAELHARVAPRAGPVRRILIYFGGADTHNLTGLAVAAFQDLRRDDIEVDVVLGGATVHTRALRHQVANSRNIHLHEHLPSLADLMAAADLAVGAGGATNWERLCLGLPSIIISLAENQRPIAEALHRQGLVRWLGHVGDVDQEALGAALSEIVSRGLDAEWSSKCRTALDGRGLARVCAVLTVTADSPLRVRRARPDDEHLLLDWANDPVTRSNAFQQGSIAAQSHHEWFQRRLAVPDRAVLLIVETQDGVPLGQVRFEHTGESWDVDYSVAPEFRGRGCGRPVLAIALDELLRSFPGAQVRALVKEHNSASCRVFEALGFARTAGESAVYEFLRVPGSSK